MRCIFFVCVILITIIDVSLLRFFLMEGVELHGFHSLKLLYRHILLSGEKD